MLQSSQKLLLAAELFLAVAFCFTVLACRSLHAQQSVESLAAAAQNPVASFVRATGHVTFAETVPDPKDYPGSLPHLIFAGSLVFTPPKHRVDLRDWSLRSWSTTRGRTVYADRSADLKKVAGGFMGDTQ